MVLGKSGPDGHATLTGGDGCEGTRTGACNEEPTGIGAEPPNGIQAGNWGAGGVREDC